MSESPKSETRAAAPETIPAGGWLAGCEPLLNRLYARSRAANWNLARENLAAALERSARWRFPGEPPSPRQAEEYLAALHLEDLALACACAEGSEAAWEAFVAAYRSPLRRAAAAILRSAADSPDTAELADSLFADLYGWKDAEGGRQSLFRWYHGRSKLSTWLRTVLAQRHVNSIRRSRRFESLDEEGAEERVVQRQDCAPADPPDPHRRRYLELLSRGLNGAIRALAPADRARLLDYYLSGHTLADMARARSEHEATASRKLERIRRELRTVVVRTLREPPASLDDAQIALCFEYALQDWPFDLRALLEEKSGP